jgi:hypothetical protein
VPNALPSTSYVGQRWTSGPMAGQIKGDIQALPIGEAPTVISPLTADEQAQIDPHKLPGVDYVGKRYTAGPNAGQLASVEPLNPRGANLPFQQALELNSQVESSNPWKLWTAGQARYGAVMASLNEGTRAGDRAAVESLAKVFDPNVEVSDSALKASGMYGGIPQMLQSAWSALTGDTPLPDNVRQQIASLATAEMKTRDLAAWQQVQRTRALATAPGIHVDPNSIEPGFSPEALTKPETPGAPPTMEFPQPWQWNPATRKFARAAPGDAPGGAQPPAASLAPATAPAPPGPPGAPGGPATPPAMVTPPNTGAPSTVDRLTVPGLQSIPAGSGGLARLGADMQANPGNYSLADRQRFLDELKRRGHHQ